jgi:hypothetical protein
MLAIIMVKHLPVKFSEALDRVGLVDVQLELDRLKQLERLNNGDIWIS